jgi:oxygen-independent coproporphyrinogen-3 oxidase
MSQIKWEVDLQLLKKYDRPGPRYTSYPTVPQFITQFGPQEFYEEIIANNRGEYRNSDVSLYFHFPYCKSRCYFCACNSLITHNRETIDDYLDNLKQEIALVSGLLSQTRKIVQVHWGGGSPCYLTLDQTRDIFRFICDHFHLAPDAEISMEIDPRNMGEGYLPLLKELGFNRLSFGVQDFDARVQKAINRMQPEEMTRQVVTESRQLGFTSLNLDLIYGLPYQTAQSYAVTLDKIIDMSPERIAVFNYAHLPHVKKHQELIPAQYLPSPGEKLNIVKLVIERLTAAGYEYIGMDHFAKSNDELCKALRAYKLHRNFQGYTTRAGDAEVYAFGITSISQLFNVYAQNVRTVPEYEKLLGDGKIPTMSGYRLSQDDKLRRFCINQLMCNNRLLKTEVEQKFAVAFDTYFSDVFAPLEEFVADKLVILYPDLIEVTLAGRLVVRNIAMLFDKYLSKDGQTLYSRTV